MLKIVAIVVVVIAAFLLYASTRPDSFRVERTVAIKAPPGKVFPHIDTFANWAAWSPWEKMDPAMKKTASGPASGKGAVTEWEGNSKVGKGRMEILESVPPSKVVIKLDFVTPMEAHNTAEFTLSAQGDATTVTWAMHGPMPFASKVFTIFASMDRLVGKDFEAGLANLKTIAEK